MRQTIINLNIPHGFSGVAPTVTVSGGCTSAEPAVEGALITDALNTADRALYQAKLQGRSRIVFRSLSCDGNR